MTILQHKTTTYSELSPVYNKQLWSVPELFGYNQIWLCITMLKMDAEIDKYILKQ